MSATFEALTFPRGFGGMGGHPDTAPPRSSLRAGGYSVASIRCIPLVRGALLVAAKELSEGFL